MTIVFLFGLFASLMMLAVFAFAGGQSTSKRLQSRLLSVRQRHSDSELTKVEAQMRKSVANKQVRQVGGLVGRVLPDPVMLQKRLDATGKAWTLKGYTIAMGIVFVLVGGFLIFKGMPIVLAVVLGLFAGLFLPHWWVGRTVARRIGKFVVKFPDAIELLVRGLRSGLPISETMGVVASEVPGPVGEEFQRVTDKMRVGVTMDAALQETADRLNTSEFQFFVISLVIQRETGGNLSETLSNLAEVLRKRSQMKLKIRAMSSESKASAYIIGALPFIVFGMIWFISGSYMQRFFISDPGGPLGLSTLQMVGLGGLVWMGIGAFVMRQMISFEI